MPCSNNIDNFSAGVAAHAFGPGEYAISGDVHLDEEEDWTLSINRKDGTNLLAVLIHEIGHALGLSHSKDPTSVMHPAFVSAKLDLNVDDIEHVQILYGKVFHCKGYIKVMSEDSVGK